MAQVQQVRTCLSASASTSDLRHYQENLRATLDGICDVLDEVGEDCSLIDDVSPTEGVLEVSLTDGSTFVLNKQEPRLQLWLSSPVSGPSQFTMLRTEAGNVEWRDLDNGNELHSLLSAEFSSLLSREVAFSDVKASGA